MKKIMTILFTVLMAVSFAACAGGNKSTAEKTPEAGKQAESLPAGNDSADNTQPESTPETTQGNEQTTGGANTEAETDTEAKAEAGNEPVSEAEGTKILVAYFSATNATEGVAETIAKSLSADIYEIVPEQPYTDADLDWNDDKSRSTIEMNDPSARPAISGTVENMEQYDILFIGYPIWWGDAPRILCTFMESYDFSGKTIVPFCTSGGSGIGSSAANLEELTSGAEWLSGKRLNGGSAQSEIAEWINSLGLGVTAR